MSEVKLDKTAFPCIRCLKRKHEMLNPKAGATRRAHEIDTYFELYGSHYRVFRKLF